MCPPSLCYDSHNNISRLVFHPLLHLNSLILVLLTFSFPLSFQTPFMPGFRCLLVSSGGPPCEHATLTPRLVWWRLCPRSSAVVWAEATWASSSGFHCESQDPCFWGASAGHGKDRGAFTISLSSCIIRVVLFVTWMCCFEVYP
jgi:hypothetical protein